MNLLDSSGWLEFLADDPNASVFEPLVRDPATLVVPSVVVAEVARKLRQQSDDVAGIDRAAALMRQGVVVPLDFTLALQAAAMGVRHRLPLADSIILATARAYDATLWTQDADFEGIDGVRYVKKRK